MPRTVIAFFLILLLITSGCQEVSIYIDYPKDDGQEEMITKESATDTPKLAPTRTPAPLPQALSQDNNEEVEIDIDQYFFPVEMLPENIGFDYDSVKQYNVSYLESPGSLLGIAHVRSYYSNDDDLYVMQVIIHSPLPGQVEMLNAGHYQREQVRDLNENSLGDYAMIGHLNNDEENFYQYRFYKENIIVIITLVGKHPFVSQDNVFQLAKAVEEKLPDKLPAVERIITPSLEIEQGAADQYFRKLELIECESGETLAESIPYTHQDICFKANVSKLISNLKVGIYDEKNNEIIYLKEFIAAPQFGERVYNLLSCEWGFAWTELYAGDYQALFWANDQLAKPIPFTLTNPYRE